MALSCSDCRMIMLRYTLTAIMGPMLRGYPIGYITAPNGGYRRVGLAECLCLGWANPPLGGRGREFDVNPYDITT